MIYLYGAGVGGFLVDTLHQLVADAALVSVTGCWGRVTKIHLGAGESRAGKMMKIKLNIRIVPFIPLR